MTRAVLLAVAAAAVTLIITVIILPHVPGSPVACMTRHGGNPCAGHMTWVAGLCVVAPVAVATVCKDLCDRGPRRRR